VARNADAGIAIAAREAAAERRRRVVLWLDSNSDSMMVAAQWRWQLDYGGGSTVVAAQWQCRCWRRRQCWWWRRQLYEGGGLRAAATAADNEVGGGRRGKGMGREGGMQSVCFVFYLLTLSMHYLDKASKNPTTFQQTS
jgi:hypothetical protein